jgi:hypothetical protein
MKRIALLGALLAALILSPLSSAAPASTSWQNCSTKLYGAPAPTWDASSHFCEYQVVNGWADVTMSWRYVTGGAGISYIGLPVPAANRTGWIGRTLGIVTVGEPWMHRAMNVHTDPNGNMSRAVFVGDGAFFYGWGQAGNVHVALRYRTG